MCVAPESAQAQAVRPALLLQQVWVDTQADLDVVEVRNPATETVELGTMYLSSSPSYWKITEGSFTPEDDSAFLVGFPEGATLAPGASMFVVLRGTASAFEEAFERPAEFVVGNSDVDATQSVRIPTGGRGPVEGLQLSQGLLILFYWNGEADRVKDADLLFWGEDGARVDKSGIFVDGPDDNDTAKNFRDDTPAASQRPAPALEEGRALSRIGDEGEESTPGNGVDLTDETSEDLGASWVLADVAVSEVSTEVDIQGTLRAGARAQDLSGVEVTFSREGGESVLVTSDANGAFSVILEQETSWDIRVEGARLLDVPNPRSITLGSESSAQLELIVDGVWVIQGVVSTGEGVDPTALDNATAILFDAENVALETIGLGENNDLLFEVQEAGAYTVSIQGGALMRAYRFDVVLGEESQENLSFVLEEEQPEERFTLSGTIQDSSTELVLEGVQITLSGQDTQSIASAEDGTFSLPALLPGNYSLTASLDGYEVYQTDLTINADTTLDFALTPTIRYTLTAQVQAPDGTPLSNVALSLTASARRAETTSGAAGDALFEDLRPGNYILTATLDEYRTLTIQSVPVQRDTALTLVLIPNTRQPEITTDATCTQAPLSRSGSPFFSAVLAVIGLIGLLRRRRV